MSNNPIRRAAAAVARVTGRAARATQAIRERQEDTSIKGLEATRVFISAVWRDLSNSRTSSVGLEPYMFVPIIPTEVRRPQYNAVGLRVADIEGAVVNGPKDVIYPGRLVDVIAPDGGRVVEVSALKGIGSDWGSYDLIDELNLKCFPEDLIPETGPNWLDPRDPRHVNLFENVETHLLTVRGGAGPNTPEGAAIDAALEANKRGRDFLLAIFDELSKQATNQGGPIAFGPTEAMWCLQLGLDLPEWAVRYNAASGRTEAAPTAAERAIMRVAEVMENQATQPIPPAVQKLIDDQNKRIADLTAKLNDKK